MDFFLHWDYALLDFIQTVVRNGFLDAVMSLITHLGDGGIVWILTAAVLLFFPKTRRIGLTMGVAMLLGLFFGNLILKNLLARPRPYALEGAMLTGADLLIKIPSDWSFPSGHTLSSFAAATALYQYRKGFGRLAYGLAALIAFSRLYLYVHYPTDILGGALLGVAMGLLAYPIVERGWPWLLQKIQERRGRAA